VRWLAPIGRQTGLTMIEMMVSMTIGLIVVGAVTSLYVGSKGAYRGNESVARIQEAGRFALDSITNDVRRAGALGCGTMASITPGQPVSITVAAPVTLAVGRATGIQGFAPTAYTLPATQPAGWAAPAGVPPYYSGDILQLQIVSGTPVRVTATPDTAAGKLQISSNQLTTSSGPNFNTSDYALLANCSAATVLQITANPVAPAANAPATLGFAQPGPTIPAISSSGPGVFAPTSYPTLQHFDQVTYYVGKVAGSSPLQTALYRYSASSGKAEELVENIEDMDIVFGVDTAGTNTAGTFEHANNVVDWTKVVSVRVSVIAVGDQQGVAPPGQVLLFRGTDPNPTPQASTPAADTRLRQVYAAGAALRDRIQVQ
jgi:type IV pilus assembly protein PilW